MIMAVLGGCSSRSAPLEPVFDIPALLGRKAPEAATSLQKAGATVQQEKAPAASDPQTASMLFQKQGHLLRLTYKKSNGRITAFQLNPQDTATRFKDEEKQKYLIVGRLQENDPRYNIEFVESGEQVFNFTGVRVVPRPVTHKVELRVSGTPDLVNIIYTVSGQAGATGTSDQGQPLLTVPPWNKAFDATDDAVITLAVQPYAGPASNTRRSGGSFRAQVQILVDGKVAQETTAVGAPAQCSAEL